MHASSSAQTCLEACASLAHGSYMHKVERLGAVAERVRGSIISSECCGSPPPTVMTFNRPHRCWACKQSDNGRNCYFHAPKTPMVSLCSSSNGTRPDAMVSVRGRDCRCVAPRKKLQGLVMVWQQCKRNNLRTAKHPVLQRVYAKPPSMLLAWLGQS